MRLARGMAVALLYAAAWGTSSAEARDTKAGEPPLPSTPEQPSPRPRIGLALGGGGARGGAHVGVLKVLERMHVPVDYIAGTSMGAVVGGLYASGVSPERIEQEMRALDWSDVLADRTPYHDLVWRRKVDEGAYLLDLEIGLNEKKLRFPTGLRAGQKLGYEIQAYLLPVADVTDFDKLPIPFRAVATDIETGDPVILDHGDLSEAILASMTIPGVFAPIARDGKLLVDGGMASNLPVEVVRAMGADIVIAVDVGTPLASQDAIQSFLGVTSQVFSFLTRLNSERSASLADLVITPDLSDISTGSFPQVPEAIDRGEEAATALVSRLSGYAIPEADWTAQYGARHTGPVPPATLHAVRIEGNRRVDSRRIVGRTRLEPGDTLDVPTIRLALRRVYGMDLFQSVRFRLDKTDEGTNLVLRATEKPWGPTYFHFGLNIVDDFSGGATYGVRANMLRTSINRLGAEWRTDLELGSAPAIRTDFFQPLDFAGRFFIDPLAFIGRRREELFDESGDKFASYQVDVQAIELDGGIEYGRFGELRVGVYRSHVHAKVDTGAAVLPSFDVPGGGIALNAALDTLDRPAIPHQGTSVEARGTFSRESFGAEDSYDRLLIDSIHFQGFGRHTLFGGAGFGTNLGSTLPVYDEFLLGGLFSLGGLSEGELRGQLFGGLKLGYHYRIAMLPSVLGQGVYVGALTEAGNVWQSTSEISTGDLVYSGTAILGADTILGPFFLAYGRSEGGRSRIYLTLGRGL
jgi:NTE family protein